MRKFSKLFMVLAVMMSAFTFVVGAQPSRAASPNGGSMYAGIYVGSDGTLMVRDARLDVMLPMAFAQVDRGGNWGIQGMTPPAEWQTIHIDPVTDMVLRTSNNTVSNPVGLYIRADGLLLSDGAGAVAGPVMILRRKAMLDGTSIIQAIGTDGQVIGYGGGHDGAEGCVPYFLTLVKVGPDGALMAHDSKQDMVLRLKYSYILDRKGQWVDGISGPAEWNIAWGEVDGNIWAVGDNAEYTMPNPINLYVAADGALTCARTSIGPVRSFRMNSSDRAWAQVDTIGYDGKVITYGGSN